MIFFFDMSKDGGIFIYLGTEPITVNNHVKSYMIDKEAIDEYAILHFLYYPLE